MTDDEHRHRWIIIIKSAYAGASHYAQAWCPGCKEYLDKREIEEHLNEYEEMREYILEEVGAEHVLKEWGGELE